MGPQEGSGQVGLQRFVSESFPSGEFFRGYAELRQQWFSPCSAANLFHSWVSRRGRERDKLPSLISRSVFLARTIVSLTWGQIHGNVHHLRNPGIDS